MGANRFRTTDNDRDRVSLGLERNSRCQGQEERVYLRREGGKEKEKENEKEKEKEKERRERRESERK